MLAAISQPAYVLTQSDMPQPGRINLVAYDTTTNVSIGTASNSSQTWNFSNLQLHYMKVASFSPTSPYQYYAPSFPGSNMYTYGPSFLYTSFFGGAPVDQSSWGYMFWKTDATGFRIVGFRGDYGIGDRNVLENPQELLMGVPAALNDTFNNEASWKVVFDVVQSISNYDTNYVSSLKKKLTVDAYGVLTTPFGTDSVYRVHEYVTTIDSVYASIMGTPVSGYSFPVNKDTLNNYYFWAKNIQYPLAIVHCDKNNIVKDIEYLKDTFPNFTIYGTVYEDMLSNPMTSATVQLIAKDTIDHLFGIEEIVNVDNNGHFQFGSVAGGNWLIQADPDTNAYPYHQPTYYGNQSAWSNAATLHPTSDTSISIVPLFVNAMNTINLNDSGWVGGTIYESISSSKSTATLAEGINVFLVDSNTHSIERFTKTDHIGTYHFKNVSNKSYKVFVEIPGLGMDSIYNIPVYNSMHNDIDYVYDSLSIQPYYSSSIHAVIYEKNYLQIYPNPFNEITYINLGNQEKNQEYMLSIFDLAGRLINQKKGICRGLISFDRNDLTSGTYIMEIKINGTIKGRAKISVE